MNHATLLGRLTKDPIVRQGENKKSAFFILAVEGKNEGQEKDTQYITCRGFKESIVSMIERYCVKGKPIYVSGRLLSTQYDRTEKGVTHRVYETYLLVEYLEFVPIDKTVGVNASQSQKNQGQPGYVPPTPAQQGYMPQAVGYIPPNQGQQGGYTPQTTNYVPPNQGRQNYMMQQPPVQNQQGNYMPENYQQQPWKN